MSTGTLPYALAPFIALFALVLRFWLLQVPITVSAAGLTPGEWPIRFVRLDDIELVEFLTSPQGTRSAVLVSTKAGRQFSYGSAVQASIKTLEAMSIADALEKAGAPRFDHRKNWSAKSEMVVRECREGLGALFETAERIAEREGADEVTVELLAAHRGDLEAAVPGIGDRLRDALEVAARANDRPS